MAEEWNTLLTKTLRGKWWSQFSTSTFLLAIFSHQCTVGNKCIVGCCR